MLTTTSPGILIDLHPTLIQKDNLQNTLAEELATVNISHRNPVIHSWLDGNNAELVDSKLLILKFTIHIVTGHFGNRKGKVKTSALVIETAEKYAQYLKTLLIQGYENRDIQNGTSVPTEIHQTASPTTYKGLLCRKNVFTNSLNVLSIKGLSEAAIYQEITINKKITNIGKYIMAHNCIKALEHTNKIEKIGKWFLLYTKDAKQAVDDLLDNKLAMIFSTQIEHRHIIP
eukprot:11636781-Ditylum_brightwellii.AAC.1